jgi:outer membrane protein assembly factor BamB
MEWQGAQQTADDAVGTMTPKGDVGLVVAGFDPKSKAIRWKAKATDLVSGFEEKSGPNEGHLLSILDIGDGRAIVTVRKGWLGTPIVMALDAKTGKKLWSVEAPGAAPFTHTLTKKRLYLVCGEWPALPVNVLDVETGKLLARIGG